MNKVVNFNAATAHEARKEQHHPTSSALSKELLTFNVFFEALFEELTDLKAGYPLLFNMNLFSALIKKNSQVLHAVKELKYSKEAPHFVKGSFDDLSEIFEHSYETLCDILGPTQSDETIAKVLKAIETRPESLNFSMNQFL